jgi:hypothetical protein
MNRIIVSDTILNPDGMPSKGSKQALTLSVKAIAVFLSMDIRLSSYNAMSLPRPQ